MADAGDPEVLCGGEEEGETVNPSRGTGADGGAEEGLEPVEGREAYRESQRHGATFQERVGDGIRSLVLWSGSPLLLLVVLAGAVARDNFRRVDTQAAPDVQEAGGATVPGGVPGM
ncbi:MAG: hypothetical protein OXI52_10730, partial [Caldilineaceae bacterium]|nr:hypothetical protein [Caldilineaceae bacterium]